MYTFHCRQVPLLWYLIVCFDPVKFLLYTVFVFPQLSLTVLFSVDFHNISCIPLKSAMNFQFCCFFIFDSMRCLIFPLNFSFNFPYFSSIVYIWFDLLCYFDDFPASVFFHFIYVIMLCYMFLDEFYSLYHYCRLIHFFVF